MEKHFRATARVLAAAMRYPRACAKFLYRFPFRCSAGNFAQNYVDRVSAPLESTSVLKNPLWDYFQNHTKGRGIWKWEHYFEIYHRHFEKFIGRDVNVLEIGIYSGGSLQMWKSYFGERCHVYGVDIEEACKTYEDDHTSVFIGDQSDREFWKAFRERADGIDVLIDDGGHEFDQQRITLEEMLPYIRPGGVYLCEDVHRRDNEFAAFAATFVDELNEARQTLKPVLRSEVSEFQHSIHSIHFYPFVVVIEKNERRPSQFSGPKHGTEWQPFLLC